MQGSTTHFITTPNSERIAYIMRKPLASLESLPQIVFLGGYASDMEGTKAQAFDGFCAEHGYGFLRFDYRGHGQSDGNFIDYGIGDWMSDAQFAIENLTQGPLLLIGSSMGGWIATKFARDFPNKVFALITIAAAPDFTEDFFWANFTKSEKNAISKGEVVERESGYEEPYRISPRLIEQGRENLILRSELTLSLPVRYFQGAEDRSVSVTTALQLFHHSQGNDIELTLVKTADHSFSRPQDIDQICQAISMFMNSK